MLVPNQRARRFMSCGNVGKNALLQISPEDEVLGFDKHSNVGGACGECVNSIPLILHSIKLSLEGFASTLAQLVHCS